LEGWLREQGHRYDLVAAVLAERGNNPHAAVQSVRALESWVEREDWMDILNSYSRCVRIVRAEEESIPLDSACFTEKATRDLYDAYSQAAERTTEEMSVDGVLAQLATMVPAITAFFDGVLVMAEDRELRRNRLALLQRIARLPKGIVDLSQVEGF
jgi:glycyl-tRNA synthetase